MIKEEILKLYTDKPHYKRMGMNIVPQNPMKKYAFFLPFRYKKAHRNLRKLLLTLCTEEKEDEGIPAE